MYFSEKYIKIHNGNYNMNIVSIFAGRKPNIDILKKYLQRALDLNIINGFRISHKRERGFIVGKWI